MAGRPVQLPLFKPQEVPRGSARGRNEPPVERRRQQLFRRLSRLLDGRLSALDLHDNRRTILTVRSVRRGDYAPLVLRLHHSFLDAPDDALRAVATFASSRRGTPRSREALARIREHFSGHCATAPAARTRKPVLRPEGDVYDLREIRDELNREYFGGRLKVGITWGKAAANGRCARRTAKRTIQLGSYSYEDKLIRLHRLLDNPRVPRYVVEAVVYHELLHAALPPVVKNGRRHVHTPEFHRRERLFAHLDRAERWVERHLGDLLAARAAARRR